MKKRRGSLRSRYVRRWRLDLYTGCTNIEAGCRSFVSVYKLYEGCFFKCIINSFRFIAGSAVL